MIVLCSLYSVIINKGLSLIFDLLRNHTVSRFSSVLSKSSNGFVSITSLPKDILLSSIQDSASDGNRDNRKQLRFHTFRDEHAACLMIHVQTL